MPFAQLVLLKAAGDAALEEEKRRREKVATEAKNRAWRKILAAAKTRLKNRAQSQQRCRIETDCCYDVASSRIVFRYYDPRQKRFVSADPLGRGATPDLYGYANGDPINYVDPLGLSAGDTEEKPLELEAFEVIGDPVPEPSDPNYIHFDVSDGALNGFFEALFMSGVESIGHSSNGDGTSRVSLDVSQIKVDRPSGYDVYIFAGVTGDNSAAVNFGGALVGGGGGISTPREEALVSGRPLNHDTPVDQLPVLGTLTVTAYSNTTDGNFTRASYGSQIFYDSRFDANGDGFISSRERAHWGATYRRQQAHDAYVQGLNRTRRFSAFGHSTFRRQAARDATIVAAAIVAPLTLGQGIAAIGTASGIGGTTLATAELVGDVAGLATTATPTDVALSVIPGDKVLGVIADRVNSLRSVKNFGGRKGNAQTRAQNQELADRAEAAGEGTHTAGASLPEQHYPNPAGGLKGGRFSDVEITWPNGTRRVINTVDTTSGGLPTDRELEAALDIYERLSPGDTLELIPK